MPNHLGLLLTAALVLTLVHGNEEGKGSEVNESSAEKSGEEEEHKEKRNEEKKTGHQNKFWVPTYQGTNPLNRKRISITTSEIGTFNEYTDKSFQVSLSGYHKPGVNRTRHLNESDEDESIDSAPLLWSGDDLAKEKDIEVESLDSEELFTTAERSNKSSSEISKSKSIYSRKKHKSQSKRVLKEHKLPVVKPRITNPYKNKTMQTKNQITQKKYVEKSITSTFFDELGKVASGEPKLDADYYKKLVKTATDNTKKKLGYMKMNKAKTLRPMKVVKPKIIEVKDDTFNIEKPKEGDTIAFKTRHEQWLGASDEHQPGKTLPARNKGSTYDKKDRKVKPLTKEVAGKLKTRKLNQTKSRSDRKLTNSTIKSGEGKHFSKQELYSYYSEGEVESEEKQTSEKDDSFTSFCDYSAWSDMLSRNLTRRKKKKSKPKPSSISGSSEYSSSKMQKPPRGETDKVNDLRKKEGKLTRKEKRQKARKYRKINKKRGKDDDYNYQDDYSEKKFRMRTQGEKNYAIKEVSEYLKEMDKKHGGRPGGDTYRPRGREGRGRGRGGDYGYERRRSRDDEGRGGRRWRDRDRDDNRGERRWDDRTDRRREDWGGRRDSYRGYSDRRREGRGYRDRRDDRRGGFRDRRDDRRGEGRGYGDRRDDRRGEGRGYGDRRDDRRGYAGGRRGGRRGRGGGRGGRRGRN